MGKERGKRYRKVPLSLFLWCAISMLLYTSLFTLGGASWCYTKFIMKKYYLSALLISISLSTVLAQTIVTSSDIDTSDMSDSASSCTVITSNISYKNRKYNNKEDVLSLQDFLNGKGYLSSDSMTGFFGRVTEKAVATFQKDYGLVATPAGFVGQGTRAKIKLLSCSDINTSTNNPYVSILPQGCTSSSGFSPITGVSCSGANNTQVSTLPHGCTSSSGYSATTGSSCGGGDLACTMEMRFCSDGSPMPRGPGCGWHPEQCSGVTNPTPMSSVPTVEFIGRPTLKLEYDSNNRESVLVGKARVRITTGNAGISLPSSEISHMLKFSSETGPVYTKGMTFTASASNNNYSIPANSVETFVITGTAKTSELFAGTYVIMAPSTYAIGYSVCSVYGDQFCSKNVIESSDFKNAQKSNSVRIIGETSPFITGVSHLSADYYAITGSGFASLSNQVTINGITKTFPSFIRTTATNIDKSIPFYPSDFNLVSGNGYVAQVSTSEGLSNTYYFNYTNSAVSTPSNQTASAVVTDGPTLALNYDSNNKEASLVAKTTILVTAGNNDLNVVKPTAQSWPLNPLAFNLSVLDTNNGGGGMSGTLNVSTQAEDRGNNWVIPARSSTLFYLSQSFNPKQFFAGTYRTVPSAIFNGKDILVSSTNSNYVTIIGETSPYISSIECATSSWCNISGNNFSSLTNRVNINGISKNFPMDSGYPGFGPKAISFNPSDFNLVSGNGYVVQVSTNEGLSNSYYFNYVNSGVLPQIFSVLSPKGGSYSNKDSMSISWTPYTGDEFSKYSINFCNKIMNTCSGTEDIFGEISKYTTNYIVNSDQMDLIIKSALDYFTQFRAQDFTFDQIKNSYFIRILPVGSLSGQGVLGASSNLFTLSSTLSSVVSEPVGKVDVTFVPSSSAAAQFLVGDQTVFSIGTFNFKNTSGAGGAIVKDVTVNVPANTVGSVTMNGVTAQVVGTTATLYNVGVVVPAGSSGVNIPMAVSLVCVVAFNGCAGVSNTDVSATITKVTYNNGSSIQTITPTLATTATSKLVASKPTITMTTKNGTGLLNGSVKIGEFTISADASGDIKLEAIPVIVTKTTGVSVVAGTMELRDASGNTVLVGTGGVHGSYGLSGSGTFSFSNFARTITKGTSETFRVYATLSGVSGAANTANLAFSLGSKASFIWNDVMGSQSGISGSFINNYPTGSQTITNDVANTPYVPVCTTMYWFDSNNKDCSQKSFCGRYTYAGLQTFDTQESCRSALPPTVTTSVISVISPNGGSFKAGDTLNIRWVVPGQTNSNNSVGLSIYQKSKDNAAGRVLTVTTSNSSVNGQVTDNGSYNWTIPNSVSSGNDYVVYVSNATKWTESNTFSITAVPSPINQLYTMFLGRDGDTGGLEYYKNRLAAGSSTNEIAWEFLVSAESIARNGNALTMPKDQYVELLYKTILGRVSDISGKNGWVGAVDSSMTRRDVFNGFMNSPESKNKNSILFSYLNKNNLASGFMLGKPTVLGDYTSNVSCTNLPHNFNRGAESEDVKNLQNFLSSKNLLSKEYITGVYRDKTIEAVKDYQASKGLPTTGMVYDFTRKAIEEETCR